MSDLNLKVRCKEKIYYIDAIREPGMKSRSGEPLDEFYLRSKKDFNPQFMEPIGWIPEQTEVDILATKEDGTHRTAAEIVNIKSDKLDEDIRKARADKAAEDHIEFIEKTKKKKKEVL